MAERLTRIAAPPTNTAERLAATPCTRQNNARQNQARQQPAGGAGNRGASAGNVNSNRGTGPSAGRRNSRRQCQRRQHELEPRQAANSVGNQQVSNSPSSTNRSAFGGASSGMSGSQARASSSRGSSSMGGRSGGGGGVRWRWAAEIGRRIMMSEATYEIQNDRFRAFGLRSVVLIRGWPVLPVAKMSIAQAQSATQAATPAGFDTPQQAADALFKAAGDLRRAGTSRDLRAGRQRLRRSADPVQDKNNARTSPKRRARRIRSRSASRIPNRATIIVGDEEWPARRFPW